MKGERLDPTLEQHAEYALRCVKFLSSEKIKKFGVHKHQYQTLLRYYAKLIEQVERSK